MMRHRLLVAPLFALATLAINPAIAQQAPPGDVTFTVPLDLTRLHADVDHVRVTCTINSAQLRAIPGFNRTRTGSAETAVAQNAVVQTLQVVVPIAQSDFEANASGRTATYSCVLDGSWPTSHGWRPFDGSANLNPQGTLNPRPSALTGTFVW